MSSSVLILKKKVKQKTFFMGPVKSVVLTTHVCFVPFNEKRLQVVPPVWHPLVQWPGSTIDREDVDDFVRATRFSNPSNIDAAVQFHRERSAFDSFNTRINDIVKDPGECIICMEDVELVRFTCYNLHYCCMTCFLNQKIESCPMCRFIPFENRENLSVAYK